LRLSTDALFVRRVLGLIRIEPASRCKLSYKSLVSEIIASVKFRFLELGTFVSHRDSQINLDTDNDSEEKGARLRHSTFQRIFGRAETEPVGLDLRWDTAFRDLQM
jgi:hypothetical protein